MKRLHMNRSQNNKNKTEMKYCALNAAESMIQFILH